MCGVDRPAVDVVVPVAGDAAGLRALLARLDRLTLRPGDTLTVVDNRGAGVPDPRVLVATGQRSSYFARNRGAHRGGAPWILFLDADAQAPADLLDRFFAPPPGERVGVLAGAVADAPPGPRARAAERWAHRKASMSQEVTLGHGEWAFAQTANCAVRREAFAAVGGFTEGIRSGGDADLCWRLRDAGWALERRPGAEVVHENRTTVRALLRQRARHGSGAAWLGRRWPGALPRRRWPGLVWWGIRRAAAGLAALARGDRDAAAEGLLDGPTVWAFEGGRLVRNTVTTGTSVDMSEEISERRQEAQAELAELEKDPPKNLEDWPDGDAKYETFGGGEGDHSYEEGPERNLGPSGVHHHEDGSVTVDGEEVDDPEQFKGDPIPGGPTDPDWQRLKGDEKA
jgi:hypothetical protein